MLIDSHCHLNSELYKNFSLSDIIKDAKIFNIQKFLSIGVDYKSSYENLNIKKKIKEVLISIGLHPSYITKNYKLELEQVLSLFNKNIVSAIGEIGLDYYKNPVYPTEQKIAFENQIMFAVSNSKPIVVHTRDAFDDTCEIIKNSNYDKFIIHCFTGNTNEVKKYLDLNCYISFSGIITFKNSSEICEAAKYVPLSRLLIETDSPYLSPHPHRGKINFPKNLTLVAKKIAELKKLDILAIEDSTSNNFNELFK